MKIAPIVLTVLIVSLCLWAQPQENQDKSQTEQLQEKTVKPRPPAFSSESWCEDQMTIVFSEKTRKRNFFSGIRIVFEPQISGIIQRGDKIDAKSIQLAPKFGIETNLWRGIMSLQLGIIYANTIKFEESSGVVTGGYLKGNTNEVDMDYGFNVGLALFDGIFAIGYGKLYLDPNDFVDNYDGSTDKKFIFVTFQPISSIRAWVKRNE